MSKASFLCSVTAAAALLFSAATMSAQIEIPDVAYPNLAPSAPTVEGFVPSGWILERELRGDLNGDGRADLLFLLRQTDPRNVIPNPDGMGVDTLDSNPRILAAAFATESDYTLAFQDHELIPRHDFPTLDDPFSDLSIERGAINVSLHYFASVGGWTTSETRYTFRYQSRCFRMIGYDRTDVARNTGKVTTLSINYSTAKVQTTTGSIENDRTKSKWKKLSGRRDLCLGEIGNGWEFDPGQ